MSTEIAKQGAWGEKYVANLFKAQGYDVVENPDEFGVWDLFVMSKDRSLCKTVQVKTMVRYVTKNYFGVSNGPTGAAVDSVKYADWLIIVVRSPSFIDDKAWAGKVMLVKDHKNYKLNNLGQYIIPSHSSNFQVLTEMASQELRELNAFKTAKTVYKS